MPDRSLSKSMMDSEFPDEIKQVLRADAAEPYPDPRLGIAVTPKQTQSTVAHPLVTIGDSLSHGFQNGAIFNTKYSWPAIVAWEMGITEFRIPTYNGFGGLPINIEWLLHRMEREYGHEVQWWELAPALFTVRHLMDQVEDWWERGRGTVLPPSRGILHNLSVYGFDARDILSYTAAYAHKRIKADRRRDGFVKQIVQNDQHIAALNVMHSAVNAKGKALSPLEAAQELGKDGIGTLVVMIGANNALSTVLRLNVTWSGDHYQDLTKKNDYSIWLPSHFEAEFKEIIKACKTIKADRIIFANVPHVTIAPIARGVARKYEPGSRYFPYYTRPWITDTQFDTKEDPHLTANQARAIDSAIDMYNQTIASAVKAARQQGHDWYLLDLCGTLDRLATRRYIDDPMARPAWWTPYELPGPLAALVPPVSTGFFNSNKEGRLRGGIFSLDGVHPTTVGYGIIAQEVINVMQGSGALFTWGNGTSPRTGPINVDFVRLLKHDTLMSDPPTSLDSSMKTIGWIDETMDLFTSLLPRNR